MRESTKPVIAVTGGLVLSILASGPVCNESLPPYRDPRDVFEATITGVYNGAFLDVTNSFDETLEGPAILSGEIEIVHATDPSLSKTLEITSANLFTTKNYNSSTGVLRVDPGETLRFRVIWDHDTDSGVDLPSQVFRYWRDPDCTYGRCIAEEVPFVVRGSVTIFEKIGTVTARPNLFALCHVIGDVGPAFCPPLDYTVSCPKKALTTGPISQACPNP